MLDYIEIGPAPCDEKCEQANVSGTNYERMRAENHAFIRQIRRALGEEPEGARLAARFNRDGDYGYYEVVCHFDSKNAAARDYAFKCEAEAPVYWDNQARQELAAYPVGVQA
jgi:hypothetical protein